MCGRLQAGAIGYVGTFAMLNLPQLMGHQQFEEFMRALVRGKYHVLLGAGASAGGLDSAGEELPSGPVLANQLMEEFAVPSAANASLKRVFAYADGRLSKSEETLPEYMSRRFSNTTPPTWMRSLVRYSWAQLWTLNIDDCVERAYVAQAESARQRPLSKSWTESHATPRSGRDEVLLVHLHGKASRARREGELVFDISSYLRAGQGQHRWHAIFGDDYPSQPFLVLGASLDEEIDLQGVLEQGALRIGQPEPSVIVNKGISDLAAAEFRRYGLLPIASTAKDFFDAIEQEIAPFVAEISLDESEELSSIAQESVTFSAQWRRLTDLVRPVRDMRHDIFAGHEPEWIDVQDDLVVTRGIVSKVLEALQKELPQGRSTVVGVLGGMFTGKSAALLSIAEALRRNGFQPFVYEGMVAPDVPAAIWWMRHFPKTVLIIDNAADFASDAAALIEAAEQSMVLSRILIAEREGRTKTVSRDLAAIDWLQVRIADTLSDGEIEGFLRKLTQNRRLGVLTGATEAAKRAHFTSNGRQLFGALAALERGRGFESRVRDEYASIHSPKHRHVVGLAAMASSVGNGFPLAGLPRASGLSPAEVASVLEDDKVADLLHVVNRAVVPRHRMFGTLLMESCLTIDEKYQLALDLCNAMSTHISPAAISEKSAAYRLVKALMSHTYLKRMLGSDQRTLDWYKEVEGAYDWNARFWEQRALAASEGGLHERAFSWAKQAVLVRKDAYTLTTVGTVLMRRAQSEAASGQWPSDSWELAESALREARSIEGDKSEYPYEAFFHYTLTLVEATHSRDSVLDAQLQSVWQQWRISCLTLDPGSRRGIEPTLSVVQPRWERAFGDAKP